MAENRSRVILESMARRFLLLILLIPLVATAADLSPFFGVREHMTRRATVGIPNLESINQKLEAPCPQCQIQDPCDRHVARVKQILTESGPTDPVDAIQAKISKETNVVLLGEEHNSADMRASFGDWIKKLKEKNPRLNCLAFEMPLDTQKFVDEFLTNSGSFDTFAEKVVDETLRIAQEIGAPVPKGADFERVKRKAQRQFDSQKVVYEVAKSLGIKIVHIDVPLKEFGQMTMRGSKPEEFWLGRNKNMAAQLEEKKKNGSCDLTVGVVGEGHIRATRPYEKDWPIQRILQKDGLKTVSVSTIWKAFDTLVPLWVPDECKEAAAKLLPTGLFAIAPKEPITPGRFDSAVKGVEEAEFQGKRYKIETPVDCFDVWVTSK